MRVHARDRLQTPAQPLSQGVLEAGQVLTALLDDRTGCREGNCADDIGAATLVAGGPGGPGDPALVDPGGRATADEVGVGCVEPVGAAGQDAGAVGRVELVSRECDVVDFGSCLLYTSDAADE